MNQSTHFRVKTGAGNLIAVYDSFRKGESCSDYDLFLAKPEVQKNTDLAAIKLMVNQMLKPRRFLTLPQGVRDEAIDDTGGINEGFFRNETPKRDLPKRMKNAKNFVALPGKKKPPRFKSKFRTDLRVFCLEWDRKTIVLMDGYDKMGHPGSFQSHPNLNKVAQPLLKVFIAAWDALDWQDYSVNTPDIGFVRKKESARCDVMELDVYIDAQESDS